MGYFNRELWVPDWCTFSFRVLINFHSTSTISYGTRSAVWDNRLLQRVVHHCRASGDIPHQKHSNISLREMGIVKSRLANRQCNKVRIFPEIHRIVQTAKKYPNRQPYTSFQRKLLVVLGKVIRFSFLKKLERNEKQQKRNTIQLFETNDLFISLVSLSYVLAPMEISASIRS